MTLIALLACSDCHGVKRDLLGQLLSGDDTGVS